MHRPASPWKKRECVLLVEVRQNNGRWEPFACIPQRPFTSDKARALVRDVKDRYPHLRHPRFRGRVRINIYVPIQFAMRFKEVPIGGGQVQVLSEEDPDSQEPLAADMGRSEVLDQHQEKNRV